MTAQRQAPAQIDRDVFNKAHDRINAQVERLKKHFPQLQLSFGYIGNCSLSMNAQPGDKNDDRAWYVFTKVRPVMSVCATPSDSRMQSWGGYETNRMTEMSYQIEERLTNWCNELAERMEVGTLV